MKSRANEDLGKMNMVKTSNKLIGEIENNELYASDEAAMNDGFGPAGMRVADEDDYRNQELELDFGTSKPDPVNVAQKPQMTSSFLKKMQTKKEKE
jgi:hypothetical protein